MAVNLKLSLTTTPLLPCTSLSPKSLPPFISLSFPNHSPFHFPSLHLNTSTSLPASIPTSPITTGEYKEVLPPKLDSSSEPPSIFDGTTRLYISYTCPYAQRVWITRNLKGLQDQIKLVPIDLKNRPAWYKEKVYPKNKVPALEHGNEVRGESLDLMKYVDSHFEGPSLSSNDPAKKVFADVLISYTDSFQKTVTASFKEEGVTGEAAAALDFMEDALSKFIDGPFFLGQISLVDVAYIPFIERYNAVLLDVKNYDLTAGRPKLATWIQEMDKIEGYKQTRSDPKVLVDGYKNRFMAKN